MRDDITCGEQITTSHRHKVETILYCKYLIDEINEEYNCNYVKCLKCKINIEERDDEGVTR